MAEDYYVVEPFKSLSGCLSVVATKVQIERISTIQNDRKVRRFLSRSYLSDHIPLCGSISNIISRKSYHLLKITEDPLSIYLHHGGKNVVYYDLKPDKDGYLEYIEVEIEAELPSMTFDLTRTVVNNLLDSLQGRVWLPLSIIRIDLYVKGESYPLAHQLILPYQSGLQIGPLGGIHQYPAFSFYEAVLREAIISTSPYYRLLCAYRLYEGLNKLREWMNKLNEKFGIKDKLPKDPIIDRDLIKGMGFDESLLEGVQKTGDLYNKFSDLRNRVAHFFLKNDDRPLLFSYGPTYYEYSLAGAVFLYHSHLAYKELANYFTQKFSEKLTQGMILPLIKNKDQFILRPKQ